MTRPRTADVAGTIHHFGNRGINKKDLFDSALDFASYLDRVVKEIRDTGSELHSFCTMTNHTHFLVRLGSDGALARITGLANAGYVREFNMRNGRSGPLFTGRYWDKVIASDFYLANAQLYIEANPVVASLEDDPSEYVWSSASHYLIEPCHSFLTPSSWYLSLGSTPEERRLGYAREMREYLKNHRPPNSQR